MVDSDISTFQGFFLELIPKIWFGKLCKIRPSTAVTLRTFKSTYPCIEANINSVEIKIGVNIALSFIYLFIYFVNRFIDHSIKCV